MSVAENREYAKRWDELQPDDLRQEGPEPRGDMALGWADADQERPDVFIIAAGDGASGLLPSRAELEKMSHGDLLMLRRQHNDDKVVQELLAPYEHRAFAREQVEESPINALALPVMVPAYEAAKAVGLMRGRSSPSMESMKQGLIGVTEGVVRAMRGNSAHREGHRGEAK